MAVPGGTLRIAWLSPVSTMESGAPGVATELLHGLAALGHEIDCFCTSAGHEIPTRLERDQNLEFVWGTSRWRWNRWYSNTKITAFTTGLFMRSLASLRLRREIVRRHQHRRYDLIFQVSNIESLAVPKRVTRTVPLVLRPDTHIAGELKSMIAERDLALQCQPRSTFAFVSAVLFVRSLVQRLRIRRADLVICISEVFRDHMVNDYHYPREATVVVPNPVRLDRFADVQQKRTEPPTVLVLGRISVRKGIEDVVAVARELLRRGVRARVRILGGPSLWSDYTKLLAELPSENSEYGGSVSAAEVPSELARSDVLLQASKYEPFALTVGEALAAGVPVVATSEVGAIEQVDRTVVAEVAPGDVEGMTSAVAAMLETAPRERAQLRSLARSEAARLFAPEVVCEQISDALQKLIARRRFGATAAHRERVSSK
jgi:glycosyltransferase involved in cell wall biosynthesis